MKQEACSGVIGTNDSHNPLPLTLSLHPVPPSLLILPSLAPSYVPSFLMLPQSSSLTGARHKVERGRASEGQTTERERRAENGLGSRSATGGARSAGDGGKVRLRP